MTTNSGKKRARLSIKVTIGNCRFEGSGMEDIVHLALEQFLESPAVRLADGNETADPGVQPEPAKLRKET